jgi:probable biosynthetic protein (TIGR04098 family)
VLIQESELRLGLVGLGRLTEYAAMTLFADTQAHALTAGTGRTLRDIVDVDGTPLYPGYFWTHLSVPIDRPLGRHQLWDRVAVGVDVHTWGPMLASSYVLGTPAEVAASEHASLATMRAASMFVVAGAAGEAQPARPKAGLLAELPKLDAAPAASTAFRDVRTTGAIATAPAGRLRLAAPVVVPIVSDRDASVGHNMLFAQFVRLFDLGERALLLEHLRPPIHDVLLDHLALVEREVYYIDNCGPGSRVAVDARGSFARCAAGHGRGGSEVAIGTLKLLLTAHDAATGRLLAVSHVTKQLTVPKARPSLVHDGERFCRQHGEETT